MTGWAVLYRVSNGLLMLVIPGLMAFYLMRRKGGAFRPIWIGVVGFVLSQVGHIPFNRFLLLPGLERWGVDVSAQQGGGLVVLGVALGLSAGVFEELIRYIAFRFWLKGEKDPVLPWKYGVGHGGVEAILTGVLVLVAFVQVAVLSGEGVLDAFPADEAELIRSQIAAYWAVPWHQALLGVWERISALLFHLGASVFVYKSFREKNPLWFLVALVGHASMNAFAVIAAASMDFLLLELLLFIFAVLWAVWAWYVRPEEERGQDLAPPPPQLDLTGSQITTNQLEESRYD